MSGEFKCFICGGEHRSELYPSSNNKYEEISSGDSSALQAQVKLFKKTYTHMKGFMGCIELVGRCEIFGKDIQSM